MMMRWEMDCLVRDVLSSPSPGHFRTFPRTSLGAAGVTEELSSPRRSDTQQFMLERFLFSEHRKRVSLIR